MHVLVRTQEVAYVNTPYAQGKKRARACFRDSLLPGKIEAKWGGVGFWRKLDRRSQYRARCRILTSLAVTFANGIDYVSDEGTPVRVHEILSPLCAARSASSVVAHVLSCATYEAVWVK